jgi:hypothetical protein
MGQTVMRYIVKTGTYTRETEKTIPHAARVSVPSAGATGGTFQALEVWRIQASLRRESSCFRFFSVSSLGWWRDDNILKSE